ncbi:hypothetical protein ACFFX1_54980 [Dactylosporangium sucinum]|uniref:Uncharacterized protein n=1 Tax=Dactylosporangium sucinum TaxID=1424081 RepID=A0A917U298_9ACTN|nr:hypothetical protein [Dactylosporangium sucinum]GGM53289.1 hypothetical protein GCM10007977_063640 [Dactylosporangium sucinum]
MALRSNLPTATAAGTVLTPYTPGASDTFNVNDLPATVEFTNSSGNSVNVAVVDGGRTRVGSAAVAPTPTAVADGTRAVFRLLPEYAAPDGLVTMTFSAQPAGSCVAFR